MLIISQLHYPLHRCIDPVDGTCNFGSGYQSFCVSVGVLRHSTPVAGAVVEFIGGPKTWHVRSYAAHRNGGATLDGQAISVSRTKELRDALVVR